MGVDFDECAQGSPGTIGTLGGVLGWVPQAYKYPPKEYS